MARKKTKEELLPKDPKYVEPDGNAKSVYITTELATWEKPDLTDPKAVTDRIVKYFNFMASTDCRPLVSGLAQALGINRHQLREIAQNIQGTPGIRKVNAQTQEIIEDAYQMLEVAFEYNFTHGKINPVTGIWISRNHYGYTEKKEVEVVHKDPLGNTVDREALEQRYLDSVVANK